MTIRTAILWASVGLAAIVVAALLLVGGIAFNTPEVTRKVIGGRWETETTRYLSGSSAGHTSLYRRTATGREQIAQIVLEEEFVGDDCVIYAAHRTCWIVCGERSPRRIASCDAWVIVNGRFRVLDADGIDLPIEELKSIATKPQP